MLDKCFVYWYRSDDDMAHTAFASEGKFEAKVRVPVVGFRNGKASNTLVRAGAPGGKGYVQDPTCDMGRVNDPAKGHEAYLR